jgi:outer membrane protein assembly factor BamB
MNRPTAFHGLVLAALLFPATDLRAQTLHVQSAGTRAPATHGPFFAITTPKALPRATVCVDYLSALGFVGGGGGPPTFAVTAGSLPQGITLAPSGVLQGLPEEASSTVFTATVTEPGGWSASAEFVLSVAAGHRAPLAEIGLAIPPSGTGGSGVPAQDTATSTIVVSGFSPITMVEHVEVRVTLLHPHAGDLVLALIAPDGEHIPLAAHRGGSQADFLGTAFTDASSAPICAGVAPFAGSYRPEVPIGVRTVLGAWKLEVTDSVPGASGVLYDWALSFEPKYQSLFAPASTQIWNLPLSSTVAAPQGISHDDTSEFVADGSRVRKLLKSDTEDAGNWTRDFVTLFPGVPLPVRRSFGSPILVTNGSDGAVYGLSPSTGATIWSRSLRRPTCAADSIGCPPVAQLFDESGCAFQSALPGTDLVFVGTRYGCGTTTANRVYALDAGTGAIRWVHNLTQSYVYDQVTGLAADPARDLVYLTAANTLAVSQPTVAALSTINGTRLWAANLGAIATEPVVGKTGVFVVTTHGVIHKLAFETGAVLWSLDLMLPGDLVQHPIVLDADHDDLFVADTGGFLHGVHDAGTSAAEQWQTKPAGQSVKGFAFSRVTGRIYCTVGNARIYQLDRVAGVTESYASVLGPANQPMGRILLDDTPLGNLSDARVLTVAGSTLVKFQVPWNLTPGDHGGNGYNPPMYIEQPEAVGVDSSLQGSTTPSSPAVGQQVFDSLTVTAFGYSPPQCIVVHAAIPAGMSYVSGTISGANSAGSITAQAGVLTIRLGDLPLATASVQLIWQQTAAGSFPRTYTVSTEQVDPVPANNTVVLAN